MTLLDSIRTTLRTVVASAGGLTDAGYVRAITSAPTVQTSRTYGSWQDTYGLVANRKMVDVADPRTGKIARKERADLDTSDVISLPIGSQWSTDKTTLWAITDVISAAGGVIRYEIMRETPEVAHRPVAGGV